MEQKSICEIVRTAENNYRSGVTTMSEYVQFNQFENINKIEAYLNSKHISGEVDSMGREKPFFNIVIAAVNIWYRATKVKKESIKIRADKKTNILAAFLASILTQEWMKTARFGIFLRDWGISLSRYGSSIVKFVEKDGELNCSICSWNRMIVDAIDFANNVKIEKLYLTPAQLKQQKGYKKDVVTSLLDTLGSRKTLGGQKQDNRNDFIELYEVHGNLPLSLITENESDKDTYVQQMHVVSFLAKEDNAKEYDEFTLVKGREKKDPYMITHLIKEDGRTQSVGAVEYLFDSQWMMNHTAKAIKDQLDLASKLIFQTSDANYVGRNVLTAIETGDILIHEDNRPLTKINNDSHDITSLQNYGAQWKALAQEISATPDALRGEAPTAGTAYRLQALVTTEAHSLFEEMRDSKDLAIEEMMREYIIPFIKKGMDTSEEIGGILSGEQIKKIDSMYVPNEAIRRSNRRIIDQVLNEGKTPTPEEQALDIQTEAQGIQSGLSQMGNQRFVSPEDIDDSTWKDAIKDLEWQVEVDTPSNQGDLDLMLTTFSSLLETIADPRKAPALETPRGKLLFNKILETSGRVSPVEISELNTPSPVQPAPQAPPIGGV